MLKICTILLTVGLPTQIDQVTGAVLETAEYDEEYNYTMRGLDDRAANIACATKVQELRYDRLEAGAASVYWSWDVIGSEGVLPEVAGAEALTDHLEEDGQ